MQCLLHRISYSPHQELLPLNPCSVLFTQNAKEEKCSNFFPFWILMLNLARYVGDEPKSYRKLIYLHWFYSIFPLILCMKQSFLFVKKFITFKFPFSLSFVHGPRVMPWSLWVLGLELSLSESSEPKPFDLDCLHCGLPSICIVMSAFKTSPCGARPVWRTGGWLAVFTPCL